MEVLDADRERPDIPLAVVDLDAEVKVHDFALELKRSHGGRVWAGGRVGTHTRLGERRCPSERWKVESE